MFLKSMICTQGFLYWIWGMLKNTNFLERRRRNTREPRCLPGRRGPPRAAAAAPRSPRPLAQLSRRVVVHRHHLHRALEDDVALAEILQRPPDGEPALHRHGGGTAPLPPAAGRKWREAPPRAHSGGTRNRLSGPSSLRGARLRRRGGAVRRLIPPRPRRCACGARVRVALRGVRRGRRAGCPAGGDGGGGGRS